MIIWLNGAFGVGKTTAAYELQRRLPNSYVFDPENVGSFLRKNTPEALHFTDYQDDPLWRKWNFELLKQIETQTVQTTLVPMTVTRLDYYQDLIGRLQACRLPVKHIILTASAQTLNHRLDKRFEPAGSWARQHIPICLEAFAGLLPGSRLATDDFTSVQQLVEAIAAKADLTLLPEIRSPLKQAADQQMILLRHIRW